MQTAAAGFILTESGINYSHRSRVNIKTQIPANV